MSSIPQRIRVRTAGLAVGLLLVAGSGSTASAQYFGQNKVQYKHFDFQVLKTQHFDIYFYPTEREGIDIAARMAERWLARYERIFGHRLRGRQPLVMYAAHTDFEQTNVIPGDLGEGTGGVTEPLRRRIVLPFGGPLGDTDHVIGHELVHAFQFDITSNPNAPPGQNGAERLPLWFIEGMAEYLSLGPVDPNTAMWLRDAARQEKLPTIDELDNPKYFPYRWGQAFWAYVCGRWGDEVVRRLLAVAAAAGDMNTAFKTVLGVTSKQLSSDWQASIHAAYDPVLAATTPPNEIGKLIVKANDVNSLNVGPSISPDGRRLALLSSRSLFSIDLYIVDAENGKVIHKLTSTATDPHYSSIQFIYSAGAWDHDSKRVAITTVAGGHAALAIFNADSGRRERDIAVPDVDEIFNPTWAPDGHAICFTGMRAGLTDLYLYDLNASSVRRLTNDAFADLQPAWSPDGKRIAFTTDRFTTKLDTLNIGLYDLALIDPETGAIEQVRGASGGRNINPQWSGDGRSLYFISDRDGIANLYRFVPATGDIAQLTKVGTGLSGITNTSPSMSVAQSVDLAAFSVYEGGKYDIYTFDLGGRGTPAPPVNMTAATLPPPGRKPEELTALMADATFGLPPAGAQEEVAKYSPKLQLEGLGQPVVGIGASRFGTAVGGGISMYFADMLGDHALATAVQFSTGLTGNFSFKDTAAQVAYFNQAHRWNWGLIGGQIPYLSAGFNIGLGSVNGETTERDQTIVYRQTERSAAFITAYPFNRADRVEFTGGVSQISFDIITRTTEIGLFTGNLYSDNTTTQSAARSLTLGTTSAAFVHDTSTFGATSPVQGTRYRIETSPAVGSINYTGALVDYRHYFMPVPFYTIAARILHYGRYGSGGEDPRLFPMYLGYPTLVRGYDIYTFDATDCVPNAVSSCPLFDRLVGSRVLVSNLEFRFPLLRPFGVSQRMYGPVPIEAAIFGDAGVAWNSLKTAPVITSPIEFPSQPHPFRLKDGVTSAGAALRVNLFGFAVGEFDFVKPFQRPSSGWVFQFNLTPGF